MALGMGSLRVPVLAADFGSFTLAPGESRTIHIGASYRNIRVCNDLGSAGSFEVAIGDHDPVVLQPGLCRRDSGDGIALRSLSAESATGLYQSYRSLPQHSGR
jgi:hypothetical protein